LLKNPYFLGSAGRKRRQHDHEDMDVGIRHQQVPQITLAAALRTIELPVRRGVRRQPERPN